MTATTRPEPGSYENQCPALMLYPSGKPVLDALGEPYRCELGAGHGGSVHSSASLHFPVVPPDGHPRRVHLPDGPPAQ